MPHSQPSLLAPLFVLASVAPAFADSGLSAAALGIGHSLLAPTDMLPIAVVLGAGVLAWLLGNRRPRVQPAPARRPSRQSDPARR